jgi:hypothetical protein
VYCPGATLGILNAPCASARALPWAIPGTANVVLTSETWTFDDACAPVLVTIPSMRAIGTTWYWKSMLPFSSPGPTVTAAAFEGVVVPG